MRASAHFTNILKSGVVYLILTGFALIMVFPFLVMMFTSFKNAQDTFRFPPKLLPREQETATIAGYGEPLPLYYVEYLGQKRTFALIEKSVRVGEFADPSTPEQVTVIPMDEVVPVGDGANPATVTIAGEQYELYRVTVDGQQHEWAKMKQTALGRFANPDNPGQTVLQNVRLSEPVESLTLRLENYLDVIRLHGMDRSLTNTMLVTSLVVLGQLATSVLGGFAFARLRFPGRDALFVAYLGTIMIPFAVLITPLYQLMVIIGWVDRLASLTIPWIFTAYGTFLMRQFFLSIPREIEEAAMMDGASSLRILREIFLPISTPALTTLATFTFLYAWNSFFWPLVIINSGNANNRVLTLALSVLGGRAADSPNLVLAGAAIAVLPPILIYIFGQRFFVASTVSSGIKG
jgi:multiple sugar transport system permease protein